jgi:hypothetical protein
LHQFCLRCADIPFTIIIRNSRFCQSYFDHFKVEQAGAEPGIKIEAFINTRPNIKPMPNIKTRSNITTRLHNINSVVNQPPEVTHSDGILTIVHPLYEGIFNLKQGEGTASVNDIYSLIAFIRLVCSVVIIDRGGLAIHSSCIFKNHSAHIFSGSSGYGKSTLVKLTEKPLLYSDEVTLVRKDEAEVFKVYHSPFRSEFHTEPLQPTDNIAGMFFIKQNTSTYIQPLSQSAALSKLLPNIFFPITERNPYEPKIFQLCCDFLHQVKPAILHFKKDNSFWRCIIEKYSNFKAESSYDYQNY